MTEYIYICPKCGAIYGCDTNTGKVCSDCHIDTIFTGETGESWNARTKTERDDLKKRIKGSYIPTPVESKPDNTNAGTKQDDIPSFGLNVLSFFFPVIGLLLHCAYYTRTPIRAAGVGKWALIGFAVMIALWLILLLSGVSILSLLLR